MRVTPRIMVHVPANIQKTQKAWANKYDESHWQMAAMAVTYIVDQAVVDTWENGGR